MVQRNQCDVLVSVITVCLNARETIEATVASVLAQTYRNIEYIVVDGASTDGTSEWLYEHRSLVSCLISEPDNGLYNAMNKALSVFRGNLVCFLNAGDIFASPTVVQSVVESFSQSSHTMMVYGDWLAKTNYDIVQVNQPNVLTRWELWRKAVCHQSVFARREVFEQVGRFDETLSICADWDWMIRVVILHKVVTKYIPLNICIFERGGISSSRIRLVQDRSIIRNRYYSFIERIIFSSRGLANAVIFRLQKRDYSPPWAIRHLYSKK